MKDDKTIYLDIMVDGRFYCQLRYTEKGSPEIIDGRQIYVHSLSDITDFVFRQKPLLKEKKDRLNIAFSTQRIKSP